MDIKDRIWKQFMETGDPGLYMLYKALGETETETDDRGKNLWVSLPKKHWL